MHNCHVIPSIDCDFVALAALVWDIRPSIVDLRMAVVKRRCPQKGQKLHVLTRTGERDVSKPTSTLTFLWEGTNIRLPSILVFRVPRF